MTRKLTNRASRKPSAKQAGMTPAADRELGFLSDEFTSEESAEMSRVLLEQAGEEDEALWYDSPVVQQPEPAASKDE